MKYLMNKEALYNKLNVVWRNSYSKQSTLSLTENLKTNKPLRI